MRVLLSIVVTVVLLSAGAVHAQEVEPTDPGVAPSPGPVAPMEIVFTSGDDGITLSEVAGREVAVTSADAFCVAQLIEETDDEVVVTVGTEDQPEACRIPGAGLTIFARGQMVEMVEFVPDAIVSFTDYTALPDIGRPVRPADYHLDPVPAGEGTHLVTWKIGTLSQAVEVIADADALWVTADGRWVDTWSTPQGS